MQAKNLEKRVDSTTSAIVSSKPNVQGQAPKVPLFSPINLLVLSLLPCDSYSSY